MGFSPHVVGSFPSPRPKGTNKEENVMGVVAVYDPVVRRLTEIGEPGCFVDGDGGGDPE